LKARIVQPRGKTISSDKKVLQKTKTLKSTFWQEGGKTEEESPQIKNPRILGEKRVRVLSLLALKRKG